MQQNPKNILNIFNIDKLAKISFLLFLVSLFLPLRHIFFSSSSYATGAYSDFTSFSFWLSDIFLAVSAILAYFPRETITKSRGNSSRHVVFSLFSLVCWIFLTVALKYPDISSLNLWFLAVFLKFCVAYGTVKRLASTDLRFTGIILKCLVGLTVLESLLALAQFNNQQSVGLTLIKEPIINSSLPGVAKIALEGVKYIRGYGTMPHPNLLSAFLVLGIFLSIAFLIQSKTRTAKLIYSLAILIGTLGLTTTFSRAGFLGLGVGLGIFYGGMFVRKQFGRAGSISLAVTLASLAAALILFHPFLATRATVSDQATVKRELYTQIGIEMITANPLFGIGIGESVIHMQQYSPVKLEPYDTQPVHNYFVLAAAEIGIPGALMLAWLLISHMISFARKTKKERNPDQAGICHALLATSAAFLVLMQFDHYFYTLHQTQLLLWVLLGVLAAESQRPAQADWVTPALQAMEMKKPSP